MAESKKDSTYYDLLGLAPVASVQEIRRAYRELSKLYHPDTTALPAAIATTKFQDLNEAYATLSSPERRLAYDLKIGHSRVRVMQTSMDLNRPVAEGRRHRSSAYLDASDRPLSAGEIFALFILAVTFVGCLILVIAVGMTRGDFALNLLNPGKVAETVEGGRPLDSPVPLAPLQVPVPSASLLLPTSSPAIPDIDNGSSEKNSPNAASAPPASIESIEPEMPSSELMLAQPSPLPVESLPQEDLEEKTSLLP